MSYKSDTRVLSTAELENNYSYRPTDGPYLIFKFADFIKSNLLLYSHNITCLCSEIYYIQTKLQMNEDWYSNGLNWCRNAWTKTSQLKSSFLVNLIPEILFMTILIIATYYNYQGLRFDNWDKPWDLAGNTAKHWNDLLQ